MAELVIDSSRRSALVVYGSETGNSQDLAEELGQLVQRLHFETAVEELNDVQLKVLLQYEIVIFVLGTTGQGDIPQNASAFWKSLLRKKLPPTCLSHMKFTSFGLGDSTYPKFNWAVRKLHKRLEQLGGVEVYPRGEADEKDPEGIDGGYLPWSAGFRKYLLSEYRLPEGHNPIPDDELLPARYTLKLAASNLDVPPRGAITSGLPPNTLLPLPGALVVELVENERITPSAHWQDVRHIKFNVTDSNLAVNPGDCLTIYPKNAPEDAQKLIELMNWEAIADLPLHIPNSPQTLPRGLHAPSDSTLRDLLIHNLDIAAVPRRSFLRAISYFSTDPEHKQRLLEFTASEYIDEFYDYTTRPRRTILEVLEEFSSVRVPLDRVLDTFPVMRGRDFSIANGGALLHAAQGDGAEGDSSNDSGSTTRIEILVALVKYRTILRKPRQGLCSRYLAPLRAGTRLAATYKPTLARLHGADQARRPLVAIATGTGIAPIRALVYERLTHRCGGGAANPGQGAHGPGAVDSTTGPPVLTSTRGTTATDPLAATTIFFGNRNRSADYFFAGEWATPALSREVRAVHTAFSRDQREKVYVQDLLARERRLVADAVRADAIFLVCGGSGRMAEACKLAVTRAMVDEGVAADEDAARAVFGRLTWWQEIW